MATHTRLQVYQAMADYPVIPVYNHTDIEVCKNVLAACYRGGIRLFEFTNRGDFAHEVFGELFKYSRKEFPEMILGVGTIIDAGTASLYIQLGANFVVSPVLKEDVATVCHRRKIGWVPGVATLSEISRAEELGAEIVKVFPGNVLKPDFVKAVRSPMPWTSMMVTGGVQPTEESLKSWFGAGVTCVGMGEKLVPDALIKAGDFAGLEAVVKNCMDIVKNLK